MVIYNRPKEKEDKEMIKDEMKMRVAAIYDRLEDVRVELNEQKDSIKWLLDKIIDLAAEVDSLEMDLECEDE